MGHEGGVCVCKCVCVGGDYRGEPDQVTTVQRGDQWSR